MRKRYLLGVVFGVLALAGLTASSLASPEFKQTLKYKYLKASGKTNKKHKKPAGFFASLKAEDPGATPAGNLKAATKVTIKLKGAKVNFKGGKKCELPQEQAASCPSDTQIGDGTAKANLAAQTTPPTVTQDLVNNVKVFLHDGGLYLVVSGTSLPVVIVLDAKLTKRGKLTVNVADDLAKVPLLAATDLKVILTSFETTLDLTKRKVGDKTYTLLRTPRCGKSERFKVTTAFKYDDGTDASYTKRLKCIRPS